MKKKYHNAVQELFAQNPTRTFKPKELARKIGLGRYCSLVCRYRSGLGISFWYRKNCF